MWAGIGSNKRPPQYNRTTKRKWPRWVREELAALAAVIGNEWQSPTWFVTWRSLWTELASTLWPLTLPRNCSTQLVEMPSSDAGTSVRRTARSSVWVNRLHYNFNIPKMWMLLELNFDIILSVFLTSVICEVHGASYRLGQWYHPVQQWKTQ